MRIIISLTIFLLLLTGCGKDDSAVDNVTGRPGYEPILEECAKTQLAAQKFIEDSLELYFDYNNDVPDNIVGAKLFLSYRAKEHLAAAESGFQTLFKKFHEKFFFKSSMGVEPILTHDDLDDGQGEFLGSDLWAIYGLQEGGRIEQQELFSTVSKTFAEGQKCEIKITLGGQWNYVTSTTAFKGHVELVKRNKNVAIEQGRLYLVRKGPGTNGHMYSTAIKGGNFYFKDIVAGEYTIALNEKSSPNYKQLATNLVINPVEQVEKNFKIETPCRWNVYVSAQVDVYKKTFLWMGQWVNKLRGDAKWEMMPIATIDHCYEKIPYPEEDSDRMIYNYRYNLRSNIVGFPVAPKVKVFKLDNNHDEQFKLLVDLELRSFIDFGDGKTDHLLIENRCDDSPSEIPFSSCYQPHFSEALEQGKAFSMSAAYTLKKKSRFIVKLKFIPLF